MKLPVGPMPVVVTPFDRQGRLDLDSLRSLVEHLLAAEAPALTVFGLASEAYSLDDGERQAILSTVAEITQGRTPLLVGCDHTGLAGSTVRCRMAADYGATAAIVPPPPVLAGYSPSLEADYYGQLVRTCHLPAIVQDAPSWTGVRWDPKTLADLLNAVPLLVAVKTESPPTAPTIRWLKRHLRRNQLVYGGYGGVFCYEEMVAEVDGLLVGGADFPYLNRIWREFHSEQRRGALESYRVVVPYLLAKFASLDTFIEIEKHHFCETGVIATATCRIPHSAVSREQVTYIQEMARFAGLGT